MHLMVSLCSEVLITDQGAVLVVLAVGTGQPQALSLPLGVRYCKIWMRTGRDGLADFCGQIPVPVPVDSSCSLCI